MTCNYSVWYCAGLCGTWLSWLVNKHTNFPEFKYQKQRRPLPFQADISCSGADWYLNIAWQDKVKELARDRKDLRYPHAMDNNYSKLCFKILPSYGSHCLNNDEEFDFELAKDIITQTNLKKVIIPVRNTELSDELNLRWEYIRLWDQYLDKPDLTTIKAVVKENLSKWTYDPMSWQNKQLDDNVYEQLGLTVHTVDIGKLVNGNIEEYNKLAEFIDEPPLVDFPKYASDYKKFAFSRLHRLT